MLALQMVFQYLTHMDMTWSKNGLKNLFSVAFFLFKNNSEY